MIADMLPSVEKGTLWRMECSSIKGALRLDSDPFEELKIPADVLEEVRKAQAS